MTRKQKGISLLLGTIMIFAALVLPSFKTSAITYQDTIDEIANVRKNSIYNLELNAPFSKDTSGVRETVNPETGSVSAEFNLFSLSGRGGVNSVDLSLMYFSQLASDKEESVEYSDKTGGYVNAIVSKGTQARTLDGFGIGWRIVMPYVEIPDERNKSVVYVHLPEGSVYKTDDSEETGLSEYKLKNLKFTIIIDPNSRVVVSYRLSYIDGRIYCFGANGLLTESKDRFNNTVTYRWTDDTVPLLESVSDNSGDTVKFTYNDNSVYVRYNEREYIIGREKQGDSYKLKSIIDPEGRKTDFEYLETKLGFNFFGGITENGEKNTYYLLNRIDYHTGAYTVYTYETSKKWLYEENKGETEYAKISKRYDATGEERFSFQSYTYYLEPDGYPAYLSKELPGNYVYSTEITDALGSKTKYIYDSNHDQTGLEKSANGRTLSQEIRKYNKNSRMPELFELKTFNKLRESKSVYTGYDYDDLGNLVYTDTYQNADEKGKNAREYSYSSGANLCIYESSMKDENTKIEIFRTLTAGGNNIASERIVENGTDIKKDVFRYDSYGNLIEEKIQIDETEHIKVRYGYDSTSSYQFPVKTVVSGIKNADGESDSYTYHTAYDKYGNCISQKNPDGNSISYTYDSLNRVTKEVLEDGAFRETVYDDKNNIITQTDANGLKLLYYYDKCGKIKSVYDEESKTCLLKRTYDAKERPETETDSRGTKYCFSYDALDRYTELTVYDESGTLLSEKYISYNEAVDVSGGKGTLLTLEEGEVSNRRKTEYLFDYRDQLTQTVQYNGKNTRIFNYEYDLLGNNTAVISPSGAVTKNEFDCFGNAIRTILPDKTENVFTFDFNGNITSETNGAGETVYYTYDGLSRLIRTESSDGERVSVERAYYDFRGNRTKTLDANNNKTLYSYNERGFLDTVKQFENATDGQEIAYTYDGEGNITKMTIGAIGGKKKHIYKYKLDLYGRMISETDPENNVATYEYDTEGNLISLRNKNGITTSYIYDGLGRVLKQTNSESGTISFNYNDFDEVTKITDGKMSVVNKYNSFGEVIETIRNSSSETYTYDNEGRVTTHTVKDNDMGEVKTSYTYDILGRTTSIITGAGTENITYDDAGRIKKKTIDSLGTEKLYSYYKNGLLKSVNTYRNEQLINTENSEYDLSGNKTLEETDGNVKRYVYDGLNRLKSFIENNGDQTEYEFDSFGNISKEYTLTSGDIKTKYYHYDNANRLILMYDDKSSQEYTYDAEGNMLTKVSDAGGRVTTSNYVYDGYNRLSEFYSQNTEAQYSYNPEGLRESKTVNGNTTRFLYSGGNIIGELMGDDYYIYHRGTELIGYTSFSGKTAAYQQNSHGNVTKLLDYNGTELKTYNYNAYGKEQAFTANPEGSQTILYQWKNETDSTHNPFRYCGEYVDAETGLIYLRNRYYDASVGRFITEDPIKSGTNWYVYCDGNPVMFSDPWGLVPSPMEAAQMAEHIYLDIPMSDNSSEAAKAANKAARTVAGWRLIDVYSQGSFKMGVYIREGDDWRNPSEYCIVNRGTTDAKGSGNDWDDNLLQPIGGSGDMRLSLETATWFSNSHDGKEITFIGHSKGGAEAMANAVATNKNAITFNPAKANMAAYSQTRSARKSYTGSMTHYIVEGEILNDKFGEPGMGITEKLPTQVPIDPWTLDAWGQRKANHQMWAVKAALVKEGY